MLKSVNRTIHSSLNEAYLTGMLSIRHTTTPGSTSKQRRDHFKSKITSNKHDKLVVKNISLNRP